MGAVRGLTAVRPRRRQPSGSRRQEVALRCRTSGVRRQVEVLDELALPDDELEDAAADESLEDEPDDEPDEESLDEAVSDLVAEVVLEAEDLPRLSVL